MSQSDFISLGELSLSTLVLGAPGSGKTVLLTHFIKDACQRGMPCIMVDGKGDWDLAQQVQKLANLYGRKFRLFACDYQKILPGGAHHEKHGNLAQNINGYRLFNPRHNHTEQLNRITKIFATGDQQDAGTLYYSTAFQNLLNAVLRTFKYHEEEPDFIRLATVFRNEDKLTEFADNCPDEHDRSVILEAAKKNRIRDTDGLRNLLSLMAKTAYADLFNTKIPQPMINIQDAVENGEIVLFLFNIGSYDTDTTRLAQMLISDVNAVFADNPGTDTYLICDEFGGYASQALADSVERGRSAGLKSILASQGLESARHKNPQLVDSLITSCGNFVVMQLKNPQDMETMANIMGTRKTTAITNQIDYEEGSTAKGSIRRVDEYIVNPQKIRELEKLQAWVYRTQPRQQPYKLQLSVLKELKK